MAQWSSISVLWASSLFSHFLKLVSSTTIFCSFLLIPLGRILEGDWRKWGKLVSTDLTPATDACHSAHPPSVTPTLNALPPRPSQLLQATPKLWKPALVLEGVESALVLWIYLQYLPTASCFLFLVIPKLVMLEKCFASDILNLGRPFGMCENSHCFPVSTSIDPWRQSRTTHYQ